MRKLGVILFLCFGFPLWAQIDTDRPAYTNSVNVVPKNKLQVEFGLEYFFQSTEQRPVIQTAIRVTRLEQISGPFTFLRYGISDQTELRLELPTTTFSRGRFSNDSITQYSESPWNRAMGIGLKQRIVNNEKFKLSNIITLRSRRDYLVTSERVVGFHLANDLLWDYASSKRSKIAGTLGFAGGKDVYQVNAAVLIGRVFGDHLWLQSELVWQNALFEDRRNNFRFTTFNLSAQYPFSERSAIDLTLGSIIRPSTLFPPNLSVQLGYAYLF